MFTEHFKFLWFLVSEIWPCFADHAMTQMTNSEHLALALGLVSFWVLTPWFRPFLPVLSPTYHGASGIDMFISNLFRDKLVKWGQTTFLPITWHTMRLHGSSEGHLRLKRNGIYHSKADGELNPKMYFLSKSIDGLFWKLRFCKNLIIFYSTGCPGHSWKHKHVFLSSSESWTPKEQYLAKQYFQTLICVSHSRQ